MNVLMSNMCQLEYMRADADSKVTKPSSERF